ncbi:MAG: hypothetical protein H8M99_02440, partial [Gloeobacteraceae cyanobacterium ES-bin-144]|nr:hypothetical protein [Verrucomicrobiales bacterium]
MLMTTEASLPFLLLTIFCSSALADYNITTFGARPDGTTLNTVAIQKAVDAAAENGGTVRVPAGTFLTGTIFLKSRVTFDLGAGAILLGSPAIKDYTPVSWGHHED